jgi:Mrp family chromosome partitioning ATPase
MSKVFKALEHARGSSGWLDAQRVGPAAWPPAARAGAPLPAALSQVSMEGEMVRLHQHLDALLPNHPRRAIQFIGSCEGEGTTTVVGEFARVSASRFGQRVLLMQISQETRSTGPALLRRDGLLAYLTTLKAGDATFDMAPIPAELLAASDATESRGSAAAWERLRTAYDLVLVDSPPATTSPQGLAISGQVDGVVLVLAAEDTRWPVAERVKQSIERSGGRVLGIVLNKRRHYIPEFIYRRL